MPAMPCGYGREFGPGTLTKEVASSELAARVAFTRIFFIRRNVCASESFQLLYRPVALPCHKRAGLFRSPDQGPYRVDG